MTQRTELREAIENSVHSDEEVLWAGVPEARAAAKGQWPIFFFAIPWPIFFFAIPWTLFSLFWEFMAIAAVTGGFGSGAPGPGPWYFTLIFPIFGIPFVLIGFGMLLTPFIAYKNACRTAYVITSKRVFRLTITWPSGTHKLISHDPRLTKRVDMTVGSNGVGTIKLIFGHSHDSDGDRREEFFEFTGIPNAREVERIISERFLPPGENSVEPGNANPTFTRH